MSEHRAEVAELKTGLVTAKAEVADLKAALMERAEALVAKAVEALPHPEPVDLSEFVTKGGFQEFADSLHRQECEQLGRLKALEDDAALRAEIDELRRENARVFERLEAATWASKAEVQEVIELVERRHDDTLAAVPETPDLSGFATREDVEAVRLAMPDRDSLNALVEVAEGRVSMKISQRAEALQEQIERLAERPGVFPVVKAWTDEGVSYEGALRTHDGALWQAQRDTGKEPPHGDWLCIVERGAQGFNGRSIVHRGTYDAAAAYVALDAVTLNGSSFLAVSDDPGPCPGDGWQLMASRGSRGKDGEPGKPGAKGDRGPAPLAFTVSEDGVLTLTLEDGEELTADLYPLLSKVAR